MHGNGLSRPYRSTASPTFEPPATAKQRRISSSCAAMGSSTLGFIGWISLLLLLATNSYSVLARLVNTTLHSTHPQVAYAPESCCKKNIFGACMERYDPYTMSTYIDPNSRKRTFFQTHSWGNEPNSSNMKRRVEVLFHGTFLL